MRIKTIAPKYPSLENPTFLIDASIYIFRYYFALPDHWFSEKESWPTAAVYGYSTFLLRLLKSEKPQRIAACFDESLGQCFRNDIYPDYKSSRALPDEALAFQLNACRQASEILGISCFSHSRYEADDLLGSLYRSCLRSPRPIALLTRDKDLGQLLSRPQDYICDYKDNGDTRFYIEDVYEKLGIYPHQIVDYLALVGDSIDNIPGVPSIGAKSAQCLLQRYGNIDQLFLNIEALTEAPIRGAKRLKSLLLEYREQIAIAQQLAQISCDLPLIDTVETLSLKPACKDDWKRFCVNMGFPKLSQSI